MSGSTDFIINFLAGGVSGAVAKTATAPIERVKLLIQTQDANPKIISGEVKRYTGIVDCFSRVASEQGVKIVYPLDYARTRLASDVGSGKAQFNGLLDCLTKTVKSGGLPALYNGIGVSIIGIIPYRGAYFGLFDTLSGYNPWQKDNNPLFRASSKFACAQVSAIAAGYASYPFDTVRRRLQMQSEKPKEEWVYAGTMDCFKKIIKNEGTAALFKGAGANALRTVGAALVLVLYSEITGAVGTGE